MTLAAVPSQVPAPAVVLAQATPGSGAAPVPPAAASAAARQAPLLLEPPAAGERITVSVAPGQSVALPDEIFNPRSTNYVIDGDDLVVQPQARGVIVFDQFFAHPENPPTLSVLGGPPVTAQELLARADLETPPARPVVVAEIPVPDDQPPAGGPGGGRQSAGGGAGFSPYNPGDIGPGLDPLGPLGPTALTYDANFRQNDVIFGDESDDDDGDDEPPPPNEPPTITVIGTGIGAIANVSVGFQYNSTRDDPGVQEDQPLPADRIQGIDPENVTLDTSREVTLIFQDEAAKFRNTLGTFEVRDGLLVNTAIGFPNVDKNEPIPPGINTGEGPLEPGVSSVDLGTLEAGTQLGFFLAVEGFDEIPEQFFESGRFELRSGADIDLPASISDGQPPVLVHIAEDGTLTRLNQQPVFVTVDGLPDSPTLNLLNPDGRTHVASWYDSASGDLVFGFEDRLITGSRGNEPDFNDAVFRLHFGPVTEDTLFSGEGETGSFGAFRVNIDDSDGDDLSSAVVELGQAQEGDRLQIAGFRDADGDGFLDGTSIAANQTSDGRIELSGTDSVENYEAVLNAVLFTNTTSPEPGQRSITLTVTDVEGNTSRPATVPIEVIDLRQAGNPADETLVGTDGIDGLAGGGGEDAIFGRGATDLLDGGDGDDQLFGEGGNDILVGGTGQDQLTGGSGRDLFVINSLGDGRDTITDFDATAGDRLVLSRLFEGTDFDPSAPDAADFLRLEEITGSNDIRVIADLDGGGDRYVPAHIATLVDPVGVTAMTPVEDVVVLPASNGATS